MGEARAEVDCSDLAMWCDQLVSLVGSLEDVKNIYMDK